MIVTALMGAADHAALDAQRRRYFPPERNVLAAHLTLFHALPPSVEGEAARLLAELARARPPQASLAGLMNLGRGVAYRVVSPDLDQLRARIAERFHGMLTAQDSAGWRPHVTIQNKVDPKRARETLAELEGAFRPRPLVIAGLALDRYAGGPWEPLGRWPFRG